MTPQKFERLVHQLRLTDTKSAQASKLVLLNNTSIKDAAKQYKITFQAVWNTINRIKNTQIEFTEIEMECMKYPNIPLSVKTMFNQLED